MPRIPPSISPSPGPSDSESPPPAVEPPRRPHQATAWLQDPNLVWDDDELDRLLGSPSADQGAGGLSPSVFDPAARNSGGAPQLSQSIISEGDDGLEDEEEDLEEDLEEPEAASGHGSPAASGSQPSATGGDRRRPRRPVARAWDRAQGALPPGQEPVYASSRDYTAGDPDDRRGVRSPSIVAVFSNAGPAPAPEPVAYAENEALTDAMRAGIAVHSAIEQDGPDGTLALRIFPSEGADRALAVDTALYFEPLTGRAQILSR